MDILSDILKLSGIEKSVLASHSLYHPWAIRFPCEQSIGFHVVTQGEMYIRSTEMKAPILMKKGDIFLAARGFTHEIATDLKTKAQKTIEMGERYLPEPGKKPLVTFASGAYRFRDKPLHSFLKEMPDLILIRAEDIPPHDPLHAALGLLSAELALEQMGSEAITRNLLDIVFNYILRNWMSSAQQSSKCWSTALRDVHLVKALKAIHDEPQTDWSVEGLASVSGLSRAAFAKKFKDITGDTPAHYLAKVRVQMATQFFRTGTHSVEEVASAVGYQDAFVFSKVFKRVQGLSPRDYKKQILAGA